ncbi:MAG: PTS fructose transporter subunit IIA [Erysipelotrichaceae bacterium]
MRYVIMVSHGEFAPGLKSATFMMTGSREDVLSCNLKDGMSADEFKVAFSEVTKDICSDDSVILMADILSGSPFTNSLLVLEEKGILDNSLVLTGMNLPMAITAVLMKDNFDDLATLKEVILSEARMGLDSYEPVADSQDDDI